MIVIFPFSLNILFFPFNLLLLLMALTWMRSLLPYQMIKLFNIILDDIKFPFDCIGSIRVVLLVTV